MRQAPPDALPTGLVGEFEQQLGHAPIDVEQHEAADLLVHTAQAPGQLFEQREGDHRDLREDRLEVLAAQDDQRRVFHRDHMSRARFVVDQRHLAEKLARAHDRENDLAPVLADQDYFHLPIGHDVERVPRVVLEENDGVLRVGPLAGNLHDPLQVDGAELAKQRDFLEHRGSGHEALPSSGGCGEAQAYGLAPPVSIHRALQRLPPTHEASYISGLPAATTLSQGCEQ